jgi:hypothetical protein
MGRASTLRPRGLRTAARSALRNDLYPHMNVAEDAEFRAVRRVNKIAAELIRQGEQF